VHAEDEGVETGEVVAAGDERTEANPPLFSRDIAPLNTAPLVEISKRLVETPPITSSLTICQAGELLAVAKSKRILSEAVSAFMVKVRQAHASMANGRSEVARFGVM
jgi:hypothetical protein